MPTVTQTSFLPPGKYQVGDSQVELTRDQLAQFAANTNELLQDGLNVPVFEKHEPPLSSGGGPQTDRGEIPATKGKGWLERIWQEEDGSLSQELDVTDPDTYTGIENGSIRYSSPEMAAAYVSGLGKHYGPLVRHVALTPKPRNPVQGPMVLAMSEDSPGLPVVMQFGLADYMGDETDDDDDDYLPEGDDGLEDYPAADPAANDPDGIAGEDKDGPSFMEPAQTPSSDLFELVKQVHTDLESCGIAAPTANAAKNTKEWLGQLCAALRQKAITESEAAVATEQEQMGADGLPISEEADYMQQFSENESKLIAQLSESGATEDPQVLQLVGLLKAKNESLEATAVQLSERDTNDHRAQVLKRIAACKRLPRRMAEHFSALVETLQFSDGDEIPSLTVIDAIDLFENNIPPAMRFSVDDEETPVEEVDHPMGDTFREGGVVAADDQPLTEDRVDEIVNELQPESYGNIGEFGGEWSAGGPGGGGTATKPAPKPAARQTKGGGKKK